MYSFRHFVQGFAQSCYPSLFWACRCFFRYLGGNISKRRTSFRKHHPLAKLWIVCYPATISITSSYRKMLLYFDNAGVVSKKAVMSGADIYLLRFLQGFFKQQEYLPRFIPRVLPCIDPIFRDGFISEILAKILQNSIRDFSQRIYGGFSWS